MNLISFSDLQVGQYYAPVFVRDARADAPYDIGALVEYAGEGQFLNESGEPVLAFWDADSQLYVTAPDGFTQ